MLEDHSVGLILATVLSTIVYVAGLIVNQYALTPLIPSVLGKHLTNTTSRYALPVSPADWSVSIWALVYICQLFWLAYALISICRQTASGPAYNNPKLLPVQVHVFFSLAVVTQIGWLVTTAEGHVIFALMLILLSTGCVIISLLESYRALSAGQPLLLQQERTCDLYVVRALAHNALALFATWTVLHATLTFALFLTFGMVDRHVTPTVGSFVDLSFSGFLVFVYVLSDLTIFDKYSRFVLTPYLGFILFHAAQLNKDWPDTKSPVFILLAVFTSLTFLYILVKVVTLLWRQLSASMGWCRPGGEHGDENPPIISRPLPVDLEEETYLLEPR